VSTVFVNGLTIFEKPMTPPKDERRNIRSERQASINDEESEVRAPSVAPAKVPQAHVAAEREIASRHSKAKNDR
jgi:hypothetical protein